MRNRVTIAPPMTLATIGQLVLAYHDLDWQRYDEMLNDPEGAALLALLCNAAAKERQLFYRYKYRLIAWAVEQAADWWAAPAAPYGEYATDTVIYIQHSERYAFHVESTNEHMAGLLIDPPRSERGWSGRALQPIARQLAAEWLARQKKA